MAACRLGRGNNQRSPDGYVTVYRCRYAAGTEREGGPDVCAAAGNAEAATAATRRGGRSAPEMQARQVTKAQIEPPMIMPSELSWLLSPPPAAAAVALPAAASIDTEELFPAVADACGCVR